MDSFSQRIYIPASDTQVKEFEDQGCSNQDQIEDIFIATTFPIVIQPSLALDLKGSVCEYQEYNICLIHRSKFYLFNDY